MPRPGFYNDNMNRSYPFIDGQTQTLPDYAVCDFGCILYAGSGFVSGTHSIVLSAVRKLPAHIVFEFTSDAPGLAGRKLYFTRELTAERYLTELVHTTRDEDDEPETFPNDHPVWTGYLVTGDMPQLATLLESLGGAIETEIPIEPSLIQNLCGSYASSISLLNTERTRADVPNGCRELCWSFERSEYYPVGEYLVGPLLFKEGYNAEVRLDTSRNTVKIEARVGAGAGVVQEQVRITPDEEPPEGRSTLDGALACDEVVRSICGVGRRFFQIDGRRGVVVTSVPSEHKIVIDVRMNQLAKCPDEFEQSSLIMPEPSDDLCDCGPETGSL
jgi:hypothetical protein